MGKLIRGKNDTYDHDIFSIFFFANRRNELDSVDVKLGWSINVTSAIEDFRE